MNPPFLDQVELIAGLVNDASPRPCFACGVQNVAKYPALWGRDEQESSWDTRALRASGKHFFASKQLVD